MVEFLYVNAKLNLIFFVFFDFKVFKTIQIRVAVIGLIVWDKQDMINISTSAGVICDREARAKKVGGEIWCEVW